MQPIDSLSAGAPGTGRAWGTPIEASAAILETIASEHSELLEFQTQALLNSTMGFAVRKLAAAFDVPLERVGQTVGRACVDLDRLEKHRRIWKDPAQVLESPNLAALLYACRARIKRVSQPTRRHRLERVLRRLEQAHELARSKAWIEAFIGSSPAKPRKAKGEVC